MGDPRSSKGSTLNPQIEFVDNTGRKITTISMNIWGAVWSVGDQIIVLYDPKNPKDAWVVQPAQPAHWRNAEELGLETARWTLLAGTVIVGIGALFFSECGLKHTFKMH
ncbi:MAG: hypothetical protein QG670_2471 [Thermoproteota archaeon]|nr:hypothetical protein [Thermoproteota archaeon]